MSHIDEEYSCSICGANPSNCICLECPECGEIGHTRCYLEHGLKRTPEQIASFAWHNGKQAVRQRSEDVYLQWLEDLESQSFDSPHAHELINH